MAAARRRARRRVLIRRRDRTSLLCKHVPAPTPSQHVCDRLWRCATTVTVLVSLNGRSALKTAGPGLVPFVRFFYGTPSTAGGMPKPVAATTFKKKGPRDTRRGGAAGLAG